MVTRLVKRHLILRTLLICLAGVTAAAAIWAADIVRSGLFGAHPADSLIVPTDAPTAFLVLPCLAVLSSRSSIGQRIFRAGAGVVSVSVPMIYFLASIGTVAANAWMSAAQLAAIGISVTAWAFLHVDSRPSSVMLMLGALAVATTALLFVSASSGAAVSNFVLIVTVSIAAATILVSVRHKASARR